VCRYSSQGRGLSYAIAAESCPLLTQAAPDLVRIAQPTTYFTRRGVCLETGIWQHGMGFEEYADIWFVLMCNRLGTSGPERLQLLKQNSFHSVIKVRTRSTSTQPRSSKDTHLCAAASPPPPSHPYSHISARRSRASLIPPCSTYLA
jgi:hypothetical protein